MLPGEEKIKDYLGEKTEALAKKIERTPMEKFFVFFLILITVSSVVLGYMQFKQNLEAPFILSKQKIVRKDIQDKYNINNLNVNTNTTEELKKKDSDLDGLDDYSEIYIYGTNPYMEDTDSDGTWDKQEIISGTNPNCAEGQVCQSESQVNFADQIPSLDQMVNEIPTMDEINGTTEANTNDGSAILSGLGTSDIQEIMQELQSEQAKAWSPEEKAKKLEELKNMPIEQIREQLIASGFDQSLLADIDDEQLRQTYQELIDSYLEKL